MAMSNKVTIANITNADTSPPTIAPSLDLLSSKIEIKDVVNEVIKIYHVHARLNLKKS